MTNTWARPPKNVAARYGIPREEQKTFAAGSQQRAGGARARSFRGRDPVDRGATEKGNAIRFVRDEGPRTGMTAEGLSQLSPAFAHDGSVSARNASTLNDGAAAVGVTTADKCAALALTPLATITGYANARVDPTLMGIGPVPRSRLRLPARWNGIWSGSTSTAARLRWAIRSARPGAVSW